LTNRKAICPLITFHRFMFTMRDEKEWYNLFQHKNKSPMMKKIGNNGKKVLLLFGRWDSSKYND